MVSQLQVSVRQANDKDRHQLANLIHFETHIHRHLDWRGPLDWVGHSPYLVIEHQGSIQAALICSPDPPEVAWIRLFAVSSTFDIETAWQMLWSSAYEKLVEQHDLEIAAIPLQQWFRRLLDKSDFYHSYDVVLLAWQRGKILPKPKNNISRIRPMIFDDLQDVARIDASAFGPIWRNSLESLELAYRQAAIATIAEDDSGLLGYQISTASPMGGHLARLAVLPQVQGAGIGYALVWDLLNQFERRGASRVTVNTQENNPVSIALYEKAGFRQTGENYPVYQFPHTNSDF